MLGKGTKCCRSGHAECLSIFSEQYNICCPVKTIRAQVARRHEPWITNDLNNACRKKNDCIQFDFILKRLQLNQDTQFAKINLPRYLEQQKRHYSKLLYNAIKM